MSGSFIFRSYRKGDEDGIAKCLTTCFKSFADFKMDGDRWLKIPDHDPGFKYETALVAEKDGFIVGHVQLIFRDLKIGDETFVKMGGIANVSTLPEYRRRGVATCLMLMADEASRGEGALINGLGTGYKSDAWRVYRRVGYVDVGFPKYIKIGLEGCYEALRAMKVDEGPIQVRNYVDGDEARLLKFYMDCIKPYRGVVKRSLEYWVKRYRNFLTYNCFFHVPFSPENVLIAEEDGKVVGYALTCKLNERGQVIEFFTSQSHINPIKPLLKAILESFKNKHVKTFTIHVPQDSLIHQALKNFGEEVGGGVYMFKILDIASILNSLAEEFSTRLRDNLEASRFKGSMLIKTDVGSASISIMNGEVEEVTQEAVKPDVIIEASHECFTQMLFGQVSVDEALTLGRIKITPNVSLSVVKSLESMFPKRTWFICSGDAW